MTVTSGLSKEIIELLEKKIVLLTEQVTTLVTENADLKNQVGNLEQELTRLRPTDGLKPDTVRVLKLIFDNQALTISQIAGALKMSVGMAQYHIDILNKAKMAALPAFRSVNRETPYQLLSAGREYLVEHGHVS